MERNINSVTISELNRLAREKIENIFPNGVWVVGEIRQLKIHSSGHWYFVLRDEFCQIDCVMWRGDATVLEWTPQDGILVDAFAFLTIFERTGRFQINVKKLLPAGKGARAIAFEMLKKKLGALGYFEQAHKKPLPEFPKKIGIVTSISGAAIRDILKVLKRRSPWISVILRDTKVQGEGAAQDIANAISEFNIFGDVDLLIVGRGGGSEEDLWCFNDERVAKAIYDSRIPIISAVGHEIDFTIADFVADMRAPTPSAAAELAAPDKNELISLLASLLKSAKNALERKCLYMRTTTLSIAHKIEMLSPMHKVGEMRQRIDSLTNDGRRAIELLLERKRTNLAHLGERLQMLSPERILQRGFSIAMLDGHVIRSSDQLAKGDIISIRFFRGDADAEIKETHND